MCLSFCVHTYKTYIGELPSLVQTHADPLLATCQSDLAAAGDAWVALAPILNGSAGRQQWPFLVGVWGGARLLQLQQMLQLRLLCECFIRATQVA